MDVAYLNCSKAFNTTSQNVLLEKMAVVWGTTLLSKKVSLYSVLMTGPRVVVSSYRRCSPEIRSRQGAGSKLAEDAKLGGSV